MLLELRAEGFEPFMVCEIRVRAEDRRDYTKHMIRLRHASQTNGREANEIIKLMPAHPLRVNFPWRVIDGAPVGLLVI